MTLKVNFAVWNLSHTSVNKVCIIYDMLTHESKSARGLYFQLSFQKQEFSRSHLWSPNNPWTVVIAVGWSLDCLSDVVLMFLSSIKKHVFLPKTNHNAGFDQIF